MSEQRRRWRQEMVRRRCREKCQRDLIASYAGLVESLLAGFFCKVRQRLAWRRPATGPNAGPPLYPPPFEAQLRLDLRVFDAIFRGMVSEADKTA